MREESAWRVASRLVPVLGCGLFGYGFGRGCGGGRDLCELGRVFGEEVLDLAEEDGGLHGLDEHFVGAQFEPVFVS